MAQDPGQGVTLLLGLMAAQFGVHAAGWAMAAFMQRQATGPEAHFAAFWLALAAALMLYLGPWPTDHALRATADGLVIGGLLLLHRGVRRFYGLLLKDGLQLGVLGATALLLAASLAVPGGHRLRLVWVSLMVGSLCAAMAWAFWRHGRVRTRRLALGLTAALGATALAFWVRAGLAATAADPVRLAFGVQTSLSTGYALGVFVVAGLLNLAQIGLVLGRVFRQLLSQSQVDPLTGVANRRGFVAALNTAHRAAQRTGAVYGLLMIDIDHFKRINDEHGHAAGDAALRRVGQLLADQGRAGDTVGRLGGEEFCLLLPASDGAGAEGLARRICSAVADELTLTVSIGVALVDAGRESADEAMQRADAALYRAKSAGRNRVVLG
jgi:diguanylate cyclase (GGDEF)-like protein